MSGYQGYHQGQWPGGYDEGRAWAPRNPNGGRYSQTETDPPVASMAKSGSMSRVVPGGGEASKQPAQDSGQNANQTSMTIHAADKPTTFFVFNLMLKTTSSDLFKYFVQFGDLVKAHIFNKNEGKSTGAGIVQYVNKQAAMAVLAAGPHFIQKKQIVISSDQESDPKWNVNVKLSLEKYQLYVSDIPVQVTEDELCEYFSQWGNISFCNIFGGWRPNISTIGFVAFTKYEDAVKCLNTSHKIGESFINVRVSERCLALKNVKKEVKSSADSEIIEQMNPLFVNNVPDIVTPQEVSDHFSRWGKLNLCKFLGKVRQNNNSYLISIEEKADALNALVIPHSLKHQLVFVHVADKNSELLLEATKDPEIMTPIEEKAKHCCLYVTHLDRKTTKYEVFRHFQEYGQMACCVLNKNYSVSLAYMNEADAVRCSEDNHYLNDRLLTVRLNMFTKLGFEKRAFYMRRSDVQATKPAIPDGPAGTLGIASHPSQTRPASPPRHARPASPPRHSRRASPPRHSRHASPPRHSRRASPPRHSRRASPPRNARPGPNRDFGPPRPAGPNRDFGPPRPAGPNRDFGPLRPPGPNRDFGPPRPAGPNRDAGPLRPPGPNRDFGPPRPAGPNRDFGPPRPPGPNRDFGPPRPPGPNRDAGPLRPPGPNRDFGPPRPAGPNRDAGPLRPPGPNRDFGPPRPAVPNRDAGPLRPPGPNRDFGPPRPAVPNRDAGPLRPPGPNRDFGPPRPAGPNRDAGPPRPAYPGMGPMRAPRPAGFAGPTIPASPAYPVPLNAETNWKLRISGLAEHTSDFELLCYLTQFGKIVDLEVERPTGCAFATFERLDDAEKAVLTKPHVIDNKEVEVSYANPPKNLPSETLPGWKQKEYECAVSGCSFKGKSEQFQRHWTKIHEAKALYLICSFCAMGCVDPDDLREHLEFFHGVEDRNEISTFQRCAKRQKRDNLLFVMPGSVTRKTCMRVAMSPQEKGAEGFFNCTECTFTGSVNEFLDHWDKQHFSGLGYLKCPKCPQTFMMKDFLLIHIKNQHQNTQQGSQTLNLGRSMLETTMPRTALSTPLQPGLNVPRPQQPVPSSLLASQAPIQQAVPLHGHGTPFYPSTVSVPKPLPPHPPFLQPGPQSGPQPFIQPALQTAHQPVPQPAPQFVVTSVTPTAGTPLQLPLSGQMITQSASAQPPQFVMEQPPLHVTQCYPSTEPVPKPLPRPPLPPHILQTGPHSVPQPASDQPLEFIKKRPPVASPTVTMPCEDPSSIPELDEQDLIDVDMGDIKPQEKENVEEKSTESRSEPEMVTEKKANEELKRSIQPGSVVALRPEWTKTLKVVHPKKVSLDKNTSEAKSSFTTQVKFIPEFDRTHIDTVQKFLLWSHIMMERLEDANIQVRRRLEADSVEGEDYEDPEELLELSSDEETEDGKSTAVKGTLSQAHEDMKARAQTVAQKVVADYRRTRQFMKGVGKQGLVDRKVLGKLFYTAIGMIKDQSKRENMDADLASKGMSWVKQDIRRMLEQNKMMQCETVEESEKASVSAKLSDRSHSFQQRTVNVEQSRKKHQQRTDNIRVYGGETRSGLRHINDEDVQMHDRGQGQFFEDDRLSQEEYLEYRDDDRTRFSNARNSSVNIRRNEDEWSQSFVATKSQRTDGKQIDDGDYHGNLRNQSCGDKASSSKSKSRDLKEVVDTKAKDQMGDEKKREGGNKTEGDMFQCEQDDISEGDLSGDGSHCEFDMDDFDIDDFDMDDPDKGNFVVMDEV